MSLFFSKLFTLFVSKIAKLRYLHWIVKFQLRNLRFALTCYENLVPQLRNYVAFNYIKKFIAKVAPHFKTNKNKLYILRCAFTGWKDPCALLRCVLVSYNVLTAHLCHFILLITNHFSQISFHTPLRAFGGWWLCGGAFVPSSPEQPLISNFWLHTGAGPLIRRIKTHRRGNFQGIEWSQWWAGQVPNIGYCINYKVGQVVLFSHFAPVCANRFLNLENRFLNLENRSLFKISYISILRNLHCTLSWTNRFLSLENRTPAKDLTPENFELHLSSGQWEYTLLWSE